jgi:RNA polymerase sigma factor (sigma-70 family)
MSIITKKGVCKVTNEQYAEAYKQYEPCLHKHCQSWTGKFDKDEAMQIAGIALWMALQNYDSSRRMTFLGYLINRIRWSFLVAYRKKRRQNKEIPVDTTVKCWINEPFYLHEDPDERPDVIKRHLNDKASKIVDLVVAGKNTTEIKQEMGISRQRVHQIFGEIRSTHNRLCSIGKM